MFPFRLLRICAAISTALPFIVFPLAAQEFQDSWRWVSYQIESGLPSNRVIDVIETRDGTAWAVTQSGIAWFRGYSWNAVDEHRGLPARRPSSITAISDSEIIALMDSTLFRGTRNGFARQSFAPEGIPVAVIGFAAIGADRFLVVDASGRLWETDGVLRNAKRESFSKRVLWVWNSRPGRVWMVAEDGIYQRSGNRYILRLATPTPADQTVTIRETAEGKGIAILPVPRSLRGEWKFESTGLFQRLEVPSHDDVEAIDIRPNGNRMLTLHYGDIRMEANGRWHSLPAIPAQLMNLLFLRSRDNGDLWAGTESGLRMYRTQHSLWSYWRHPAPDRRNQIADIIKTRDGSIWVAAGMLVEIHRPDGRMESLTHAAGIPLVGVTGMVEDGEGNVWLSSGSMFFGVLRWNGSSWRRYGVEDGLGALTVHKIKKDRNGRLWFLGIAPFFDAEQKYGTEPGAYVYENGKFTRWGVGEGLIHGRVFTMAEGTDGSLWFGTAQGLSRWRKGSWRHWTRADGLRSDRVFTMDFDDRGRLWLSDQTNGICIIDSTERPAYLTTRDGLISDAVWEIRADERGKLWIAAVGGLSSCDHGVWSRFDAGTGLTSLRLWPILPTNDVLYIGTRGSGTALLDLRAAETPAPMITIHRPVVESQTVLVRWSVFPYWGEMPAQNVETRYRLDASTWSSWRATHEQVLIDIGPGSHTIQVQAKGLFGVHDDGTSASFTVPAPWYRSIPFIVGLFLVVGAIVLQRSIYLRRKREQEHAIHVSERRYRSLFEDSPLSIWEEDFSEVHRAFSELRAQGIANIRAYLGEHPAETARIARLIRIVDVNRATLTLYRAETKEDLLSGFRRLMDEAPGSHMRELLSRFAEGATQYEAEVAEMTLTGEPIYAFVRISAMPGIDGGRSRIVVIVVDISDRKQLEHERENLIANLEEALAKVKSLRGLIPICSSCKKIRDDNGYWNFLEQYITQHSDAVVSHGLCPDCAKRLYPDIFDAPEGR